MNDQTMNQSNQTEQTAPAQESVNKPLDVLRDGALKASIFRNVRDGLDFYSVDSGRIYTDDDGNIKEAKSLSPNETLRMSRLLEKSYDRIGDFRNQRKEELKSQERER